MKHILAIETSCDETAASVVGFDDKKVIILSNIVSSQIDIHKKYGGVVPEVASRAHLETISLVIKEALINAKVNLKQIDYFAVTYEPGLIGSLLIGIQTAKTLAWAMNKPLIKVNHLDGHFYSALIQNDKIVYPILNTKYPILSLLVSGGHTQLMLAKSPTNIKIIGQTQDDAAGEAFDKASQILGLGYPGGPAISAAAEIASCCHSREGGNLYYSDSILDPRVKPEDDKIFDYSLPITDYQLPIPMIDSNDLNFSYSGLKTALLYKYQNLSKTLPLQSLNTLIPLLAYNFQDSLVKSLVLKVIKAAKKYQPKTITLVGGVAANKYLREELKSATQSLNPSIPLLVPDQKFCTDNAAMIAVAAIIKLKNK